MKKRIMVQQGESDAQTLDTSPARGGAPQAREIGGITKVPHSPLLVVLSGPSGVGKTTLTRAMVQQGWPGHVMVTVTTRRPRPGEIDGIHYHFKAPPEFHRMNERGELLESAQVHGNWYGVPARPVREELAAGHDVILTIDPQGAESIRGRIDGAVLVFVAPESLDELIDRVERHSRETPEQRTLRLLNAEREMAELSKYDYLIVNARDQHLEAVERLKAILLAEHSRVHPRYADILL